MRPDGEDRAHVRDPASRAVAEQPAVRADAVPARRRADARVRHHGHDQPGARLALHDRRLPDGDVRAGHRLVLGSRCRSRWSPPRWSAPRWSQSAAQALRARPPHAGARHLRGDPDRQRGGAHDLGQPVADAQPAGRAHRAGRAARRRALRVLSPGDHRGGRRRRGAACISAGDQNQGGDAGARRRLQPRDGGRDGREHPAPLHRGVRRSARRCARWPARCSGRSSRCRSAWARTS